MLKSFARYMRFGKTVQSSWTGEVFKLIEDMDEQRETVRAVNVKHLGRYDLLKAWEKNWETNSGGFRDRFTGDIEQCKQERISYEEELKIDGVVPHDTVRFITPTYDERFRVRDLEQVMVNGEVRRVVFVDAYHFAFVESRCYHICEFAELCERNGMEVEPVAQGA